MPRVHVPVIRWTGVVSMWCASSLLDDVKLLVASSREKTRSTAVRSRYICRKVSEP